MSVTPFGSPVTGRVLQKGDVVGVRLVRKSLHGAPPGADACSGAGSVFTHQGRVLSSANGVEAWRNMVITAAKLTKAKGGCPLGSLGGQLAESDPEARALIAAGFDQWAAVIGDALRSLHADGKLPSGIDPDDLATTLLATLQGGLLLAQVQRSTRPFETAVDTLLALAVGR